MVFFCEMPLSAMLIQILSHLNRCEVEEYFIGIVTFVCA